MHINCTLIFKSSLYLNFAWLLKQTCLTLGGKKGVRASKQGEGANQESMALCSSSIVVFSRPQQTVHILASWEQGRTQLTKQGHMTNNDTFRFFFSLLWFTVLVTNCLRWRDDCMFLPHALLSWSNTVAWTFNHVHNPHKPKLNVSVFVTNVF